MKHTEQDRHYRGKSPRNSRKPWLIALLIVLAVGVLGFTALEVYIGINSRNNFVGEPQVMVIFGCQVKPDGPSVLLRDRLDAALDYLEDHPDIKIVVTGGKGDDEHISEAQCMYEYLTEHGVDGSSIYKEDRSRNTWQNVNYTFALIVKEGLGRTDDIILVSSGFHLARIQILWDRVRGAVLWDEEYNDQYVSTLAAPVSHVPSKIQMFFREPLALVKSFVFDRTLLIDQPLSIDQ